jgi:hypothetical protein
MEDSERDEEERPRPRVVDKRVTARPPGEAPAPAAQPPPDPPSPPAAPAPEATGPETMPPPPEAAAQGPAGGQVWTPEQEEEARRMVEEIRRVPSADWVLSSLMTLVNVASVKLEAGDLEGAQLAIDSLSGVLDAVGSRLGNNEAPLRGVATQLKMAYAQAAGT